MYIHGYTVVGPHLPSFCLSLPPLFTHWYSSPSLGRTCATLPFSDFVEEKEERKKEKN
jgi:hypothetical protein